MGLPRNDFHVKAFRFYCENLIFAGIKGASEAGSRLDSFVSRFHTHSLMGLPGPMLVGVLPRSCELVLVFIICGVVSSDADASSQSSGLNIRKKLMSRGFSGCLV
jgi:hypothetical protein